MTDHRIERKGFLPQKGIRMPEVPWRIPKKIRKERSEEGPEFLKGFRRDARTYKDIQDSRASHWAELVERFEANPDFYNAYHWLNHHPLFWTFHQGDGRLPVVHEKHLVNHFGMPEALDIDVVRFDPETMAVSDDPARNTELRVTWELDAIGTLGETIRTHVYKLDGGAPTYEEAVIRAAKKIHKKYGNDRQIFDEEK